MSRVAEFEYLEARTVQEACALLREHGEEAKLIAGGIALAILLKYDLLRPRYLINIKTIPGLDRIECDPERGLSVGALVRHQWIADSPAIAEHYPVLSAAAGHVASLPIRHMGTVGGSITHADPATDMASALIAAGARVHMQNVDGERVLPVEEFFVDTFETQLAPGEILTRITVAPELAGRSGAHEKLRKNATDIPIVSASVSVASEGAEVSDLRIGLAAAAPRPIRCPHAEDALRGGNASTAGLEEAAAMASEEAEPVSDLRGSADYRRKMVRVLVRRALTGALGANGVSLREGNRKGR
jgi:carbon-monoxide dehydrogenase medium subunit